MLPLPLAGVFGADHRVLSGDGMGHICDPAAALEPGTELPIHRHPHTAETYIVLRGTINVFFYNDDRMALDKVYGYFRV